MTKRSQIQSTDLELPETQEIDLALSKPVDHDQIYAVTNESMHDERLQALLKEEKEMRDFMEEKVTFMIAQSDDEHAIDPVPCGVNGVHKYFKRGVEYREPRKFIDSLIKVAFRVKTINYEDKNGVYQTKLEKAPVLAYPIQILNDPSGIKGQRWFQHQQKNAF